jgi:hypothetical protein
MDKILHRAEGLIRDPGTILFMLFRSSKRYYFVELKHDIFGDTKVIVKTAFFKMQQIWLFCFRWVCVRDKYRFSLPRVRRVEIIN